MVRRAYATQKTLHTKDTKSTKNANTLFSVGVLQFFRVFRTFRGPDFGYTGFVGAPSGAINGGSLTTASRLKALLRNHVILHCCLMLRVTSVIIMSHNFMWSNGAKSYRTLVSFVEIINRISICL